MKTTHPLIRAETSKKDAATTSAREDPEPIIRLRIDKPLNWAWELTTSADALPIIQLLNKDGRLLLETCNKTAQRARGSFKDGLESLETFPEDVGSGRCRNVDGFSTKFGGNFQTRRSKSSPDVRKRRKEKRLSSIIDESGRKDSPEDEQRSTGGRRVQRRLGHSASGDLAVVEAEPARDVGNDLEIVKSFLREKLRQKMNQETERLRKTPSEGVIREAMTPEASYRTRRIRSATNVNASQQESVDKGSPGGSGKRKAYRKTKSDVILAKMGESLDSDRLSEDERMERSWREYKERKKLERMGCREVADEEEDFMSKPRWKDWQRPGSCQVGNCRVCQNMELKGCQEGDGSRSDLRTSSSFSSCSLPRLRDFNNVARKYWKPEVEVSRSFRSARKSPSEATLGLSYGTSTSSLARTTAVEANDRPGTDLQENYLLVEHPESETKDDDDGGGGGGSPDFGYDTISRQASATSTAYRGFYGNTKVGKSETFRVIDGSEGGGDDGAIGYRVGSGGKAEFSAAAANEDIARDYFKRVYELLKQRQEEQKEKSREAIAGGALEDNTSSSSYVPQPVKRKRWKRDRKSETVTEKAPPTSLRSNVEWKEPQQRPLAEPTKSGAVQSLPRTRDASVGAKCPKRPAPPPPPPPPHSAPAIASKLVTNQDDAYETIEDTCDQDETQDGGNMGSNLSRHSGKGLSGRRTQSSGDLCEPSGKKSDMDRIGNARTSMKRGRYKFCGSLPNHLDDKDSSQEESKENNNVISLDSLTGTFSSTKVEGTKFFDSGESPLDTLDLVKHRAESSYDEADPWRYREDSDMHLDLVRSKHSVVPVASKSLGKSRQPSDQDTGRKRSIGSRKGSSGSEGGQKQCCHHRKADLDLLDTLERGKSRGYGDGATKESRVKFATDVPGTPKASEPRGRKSGAQGLDLTLNKGEPLDQGYSSERSPEVEHPPDLNASQPFPNITPEDTFRVTLQKTSRGLGFSVSGGGTSGPVRVNRLFPQQPAALSKMLQPGDILLAANGIPLTGLTNYEALEVLRTTANVVELVVCRMPGEGNPTPPGTPPPPPARRERPSSLRCPPPLPPPLLLMEPCGEFDIEMTKVAGSLGFTLRKVDSSVLGHYVRALVREPALSDGRIQPGDKIVAVDGVLLSPMSHEEAVQLLRQCGPKVKLRLYRDLAQTPVSALSPTETDKTFNPPRLNLRQEAVDMLCDLAVRKLSPAISSNSSCKSLGGSTLAASRTSPRKLAKRHGSRSTDLDLVDESVTKVEPNTVTSETSDSSSLPSSLRRTNLSDPFPPEIIFPPEGYDVTDDGISASSRPNFLDLSLAQGKPCFFFNNRSDGSRIHVGTMHGDGNGNGNDVTDGGPAGKLQADAQYLAEPVSMPPVLSTEEDKENAGFSYKNPVYQSANPTCTAVDSSNRKAKTTCLSEQNIPGVNDATGSKSLLKWKGVMFTTSEKNEQELEENSTVPTPIPDSGSTPSGVATGVSGTDTSATFVTDSDTISNADEQNNEVFMVELTRGWNSRLGFSLQAEDGRTVVSVVHPDSIAAKDGRLKEGDVIIMVNDESVEEMTTQEIIDLLRKIRGSIGITVMRRRKAETPPEATT